MQSKRSSIQDSILLWACGQVLVRSDPSMIRLFGTMSIALLPFATQTITGSLLRPCSDCAPSSLYPIRQISLSPLPYNPSDFSIIIHTIVKTLKSYNQEYSSVACTLGGFSTSPTSYNTPSLTSTPGICARQRLHNVYSSFTHANLPSTDIPFH